MHPLQSGEVGRSDRLWGTSWRQRLRLAPLFVAMCVADVLARFAPAHNTRNAPWGAGVSVVIPERDAPSLLTEALDAVVVALDMVAEPHEIIVVVNGAIEDTYDDVRARHPGVRFLFHAEPLGFSAAVKMGLAAVRYPGTLLLNNDMRIAPPALTTLLASRGPDVFAIGAQIFQANAQGRREETGFTDWYTDGDGVHLFHAPVSDEGTVVPHLCASGGASLFRTAELREYVRSSTAYDPFYWEDAEWGVRAWRDGWKVLFAPAAQAFHHHRATTARFHAPEALARIIERNRLLFDARQNTTPESRNSFMRRVCDLPYESQRELAGRDVARSVLRQRVRARRAPQPLRPAMLWTRRGQSMSLPARSYSYRLRAFDTARRRLLVVSPFAIFPPRHGGARRVTELMHELRRDHDIILVSDEAHVYGAQSFSFFEGLAAVYLVQASGSRDAMGARTMEARMREHTHPALVSAVRDAISTYGPQLVQIEHAELAPLVQQRVGQERWVLGLHDACVEDDFGSRSEFVSFEREALQAFDAVTVCSSEDAAMVRHPRLTCVPNGSAVALGPHAPSGGTRLLFVGPFRYGPNASAIAQFLRDCYPIIREAIPDIELTVLAGDEGVAPTRNDPVFHQPGVTVLGHRDDVPRLLDACTMSINPLTAIRGSAVKLVESLSAGRVCVSTEAGARGFHDQGFSGLVIVPDVQAMAGPIIHLLTNAPERHRLEAPDRTKLAPYQWSACAALQREVYAAVLTGTATRPRP